MIKDLLQSKFTEGNIDVEIIGDVKQIDNGIEIFARVWKDGKQLGFGKDGSVDIERFRFFNIPNKDNPEEFFKKQLAHTAKIVGKDGNIIKGKVGNTTTTVYPESGDGEIYHENASWATVHDAGTGSGANYTSTGTFYSIRCDKASGGGTVFTVGRGIVSFNTSAIGADTINSATLSLYGDAVVTGNTDYVNIVRSTPASRTTLATTDYGGAFTADSDIVGSTDLNITSWSTIAYNDFSLNATGISWIDGGGYTDFGVRLKSDFSETASHSNPPGVNQTYIGYYKSEQTGTDNDPKLVIEHASVAFLPRQAMIM